MRFRRDIFHPLVGFLCRFMENLPSHTGVIRFIWNTIDRLNHHKCQDKDCRQDQKDIFYFYRLTSFQNHSPFHLYYLNCSFQEQNHRHFLLIPDVGQAKESNALTFLSTPRL